MTTIYTTLPIYDSVLKQDYQRTGCIVPIYCPRHRLPSWQYNVGSTAVGAVTQIDMISVSTGISTNITTYFPTLSDDYALSTDTYYKYDGDTLNYLLSYGVYYLKITHANDYVYYSEIFTITDIYPKLVTSWANETHAPSGYTTFTTSGSAITSAVENAASAAYAYSNSFEVAGEEVLYCIFYHTQTSGEAPQLIVRNNAGAISNTHTCTAGLNVVTFTITTPYATANLQLYNSTDTNYSMTEVYLIRRYSADYVRIDFHDTHDLGDIVYQDGFTQSLWLATRLNTPTHEPVLFGEEKNGIFITEKIVTKFKFRIVTYVGPVLYRALTRLPQHDDISIIDEVGFIHTPNAGNLAVNPINWSWFDTGTLEIVFNNDDEFIWTSEANNLT